MTWEAGVVAGALVALGVIDGAFSGYRASLGHDGLVDHRAADRAGARRGALAALVALAPAVGVGAAEYLAAGGLPDGFGAGGRAMLLILGGYGAVMLAALVAYRVSPWRQRFLASSILLGPLSLLRTPVVVAAVVATFLVTRALEPSIVAALAGVGVLAIEPVLTRRYARAAVTRTSAVRPPPLRRT